MRRNVLRSKILADESHRVWEMPGYSDNERRLIADHLLRRSLSYMTGQENDISRPPSK